MSCFGNPPCLDFIDVIPESKIHDIDYVERVITQNRQKSLGRRNDIRKYAMENFSWDTIATRYLATIASLQGS